MNTVPIFKKADVHGRGAKASCVGVPGFTLVELVLVIALTGVVAAGLMVFFIPATNSYFDARRRAGLTDHADTALRRMARDIRIAVPNSIRSPGNQCFELLPTLTGGRYRMASDVVSDAATCTSATCSAPLDTSQSSTGFDVLSPMPTLPAVGDWVVVGNQNPNDVYAGTNRTAITAIANAPNAAFGQQRLTFGAQQFPLGYAGGRFSIVANNGGAPAVFYICDGADGTVDAQGNGKGTLYQLSRPFAPAYPASCPAAAGAAVVTRNVRSCNFVYSPSIGSTQQRGFVWMQLDLSESNETLSLSFGAHVDNVP
ncbi:type II secretion system protein [Noviherbaspirillum saxi]|uniref:Type II secretion system protein n=1 Tax=Noviherbaspirillum saxi TaxID=2320863 RepID=A0A3A3FU86_9BURK|nr:type II secretion system protein [Noviherbaspirillum saxi]RJF98844.1 type II secretion system protein [Noviherbaspirillum saxi]